MDIQLREGVFDRTCNYVQMNCAVMGLVIKELDKLDGWTLALISETVNLRQLKEAMKKSLNETNQTWAIRQVEPELIQCVKQSRAALREN